MPLKPEQIERVVVRGANWVGDAVMTVPALRELRLLLPGAHITLATRPWAEGVFAGADFVDDLLLLGDGGGRRGARGFFRQLREWRARRFDLALLFPNAFAPALTAFAARVPLRFGYATDGRAPLLTHAPPAPDWRSTRHEVFYYLNLISELRRALAGGQPARETGGPATILLDGPAADLLGGPARHLLGGPTADERSASLVTGREPQFDLRVSDERKAEAAELLRRRGVTFARPVVALCPGSTNSRAKRWPAERYAALADMLMEEAGVDVVLVGAREELEVTREVVAAMSRAPVVLTGETDLARSVAVLSLADLLVSNDTGPAHVAAALGRPVVVVFGPTNPLTTRPFSALAEVVRRPPECAPCMLRDCPIDHRCMTAVAPAEVFARSLALLARAGVVREELSVAGAPGAAG
jgi:heptosyltransferase-2